MTAEGDADIFERDLGKGVANYVPLSPVSFLFRSAAVYPEKAAVVHGKTRLSYQECKERCCRFASALVKRVIGKGDSVAIRAANTPSLL